MVALAPTTAVCVRGWLFCCIREKPGIPAVLYCVLLCVGFVAFPCMKYKALGCMAVPSKFLFRVSHCVAGGVTGGCVKCVLWGQGQGVRGGGRGLGWAELG